MNTGRCALLGLRASDHRHRSQHKRRCRQSHGKFSHQTFSVFCGAADKRKGHYNDINTTSFWSFSRPPRRDEAAILPQSISSGRSAKLTTVHRSLVARIHPAPFGGDARSGSTSPATAARQAGPRAGRSAKPPRQALPHGLREREHRRRVRPRVRR